MCLDFQERKEKSTVASAKFLGLSVTSSFCKLSRFSLPSIHCKRCTDTFFAVSV